MSNLNHFLGNQLHTDNSHPTPHTNNTIPNQHMSGIDQFSTFQNHQPVYTNVQSQQGTSFTMNDTSNNANPNLDLYTPQPMDSHSNHSHYSLLNQNLKSPQFNPSISSITPMTSLTPTSIPLLSQPSGNTTLLPSPNQANLIPSSVSMTPQLSVNSQMGLNDFGSPDLKGNNSANPNHIHSNSTNNNQNNSNNYNLMPEISSVPSRTVYLGNIPNNITANELLNHVRSGTVESLKLIPSKNCAFISFLDEKSATLFHSDAILKRLTINNHDIKIGWGKPSPVQPVVASCVQRYNATRNVYIGNLLESTTEEELRNDCKEYGEIDTIKMLSEKKIAFVHFTSILAAIRCVQSLPLADKYKDRRIFYGKDRCAFITKTQQHNAAQYLGLNPNTDNFLNQVDRDLIANALVQQSNAAAMIATSTGGSSNLGNRTIYLGNLHPDSTIEEICNVVRGGILQNIRLINERHVCFITFIDPISAAQFYAMSSLHGLIIHNRKIKVGWGKHSGPLPNSINLAVGNGASRNIYIGGLDKIPEIQFTKEKLYYDFKEFGEIEQINFFQERHCCFVNFTNISNAIKAIDGIRNNPDYHRCKINFGKDRCGNTPRQFQLSNSNETASNGNNNQKYNGNNQNSFIPEQGIGSTFLDSNNMNNNDNGINGGAHYTGFTSTPHNTNHNDEEEEDDDDDDSDDYIDEAKINFQPLGITLDRPSGNS